jgi:hypothetical protein
MLVVNTRDTALYPIAAAALASVIAGITFAMFGPILFERYFWLPVAMVWSLWALRREELRRPRVEGRCGRETHHRSQLCHPRQQMCGPTVRGELAGQ